MEKKQRSYFKEPPRGNKKRTKAPTNLSTTDFDNLLRYYVVDKAQPDAWKRAFVNYLNLNGDLFAFCFFQTFSYLGTNELNAFFRVFFEERKKRENATAVGESCVYTVVQEECLRLLDAARSVHVQIDLLFNVFSQGLEAWKKIDCPSELVMRTRCKTAGHRHCMACVLLELLPAHEPYVSVFRAWKRCTAVELFRRFLVGAYKASSLERGENCRKLMNSTLMAPLVDGVTDEKKSKLLANIRDVTAETKNTAEYVRMRREEMTAVARSRLDDEDEEELFFDEIIRCKKITDVKGVSRRAKVVTIVDDDGQKKKCVLVEKRRYGEVADFGAAVRYFVAVRTLPVWEKVSRLMYMTMQQNRRGSAQFRFNILHMETYMLSSASQWHVPKSGKKMLVAERNSDGNPSKPTSSESVKELCVKGKTPELHHVLAAKWALKTGDVAVLERNKWLRVEDIRDSPERCEKKKKGNKKKRAKVLYVRNSKLAATTAVPGVPSESPVKRKMLSQEGSSTGRKRLFARQLSAEEVGEWIDRDCRFALGIFLYFETELLERMADMNVGFNVVSFKRSPELVLKTVLNKMIGDVRGAQIVRRAISAADAVLSRVLQYDKWHAFWDEREKTMAVKKIEGESIKSSVDDSRGVLAIVDGVRPLRLTVINGMAMLVKQLNRAGESTTEEDLMRRTDTVDVANQLLRSFTRESAGRDCWTSTLKCKLGKRGVGNAHGERGEAEYCCIWTVFSVHGVVRREGSSSYEVFGVVDYGGTKNKAVMKLSEGLKRDNKKLRFGEESVPASAISLKVKVAAPACVFFGTTNILLVFPQCGCWAELLSGEFDWKDGAFHLVRREDDREVEEEVVVAGKKSRKDNKGTRKRTKKNHFSVRECSLLPGVQRIHRSQLTRTARSVPERCRVAVRELLTIARGTSLRTCAVHSESLRRAIFLKDAVPLGKEVRYWTRAEDDQLLKEMGKELETGSVPLWWFLQVTALWACLSVDSLAAMVPVFCLRTYMNLLSVPRFLRIVLHDGPGYDFRGDAHFDRMMVSNVCRVDLTTIRCKSEMLLMVFRKAWKRAYDSLIRIFESCRTEEIDARQWYSESVQAVREFVRMGDQVVRELGERDVDVNRTITVVHRGVETLEMVTEEDEAWAYGQIRNFMEYQSLLM